MTSSSNYQISYGKKNFVLKNSGKFNEKYHKIQELGYGGFSKVYRVQNIKTKEVFACKEIVKSHLSDPDKFSKEINILSKCDHPNIIKLYEVYEDSRYFDLIMEVCIGGSLLDKLIEKMDEEGKAYSENEAANIFKQIMLGINYCHKQGIAHRDLKLENILFLSKNKNSTIKIIDFGLSHITRKKLVQIITGKNFDNFGMESIVGTTHYISPEVLQGKYNQKCDIWSAGVILYALLSGHFPFKGSNNKEIYNNIKKINFDFNKEEWKLISNEAKDLIKNMLCIEDKRFNAEQVLNHIWLTKMSPNLRNTKNKINITHLKNYKNSSNFKKFIISYMASRLDESEIKNLKKNFYDLDINKDGTISLEELKQSFLNINKVRTNNKISLKEINDIFKSIDLDNSKRIEYTEFISAMMEQNLYCEEEKLINTFKLLDKDGSGKISKDEIKKALGDKKLRDIEIKNFINKFDLDGNGEIDYYEFVSCMNSDKDY